MKIEEIIYTLGLAVQKTEMLDEHFQKHKIPFKVTHIRLARGIERDLYDLKDKNGVEILVNDILNDVPFAYADIESFELSVGIIKKED